MGEILVRMSLSATALIALTAALRMAFGRTLPRRAFIALWDVAALRLLVPGFIPWRFAPQAVLHIAQPRVSGVTLAPVPLMAQPGIAQVAVAAQTAALPFSWKEALFAVWLTGAILLGAATLLRYARSVRVFADAKPFCDPRAAAILRDVPLRRRVRIGVCKAIASPLSYGVFRPVILLPEGMEDEGDDALAFVLLHELSHIRAMDAARKVMLLLCRCLHWMNPAVHGMLALASRDMELLCDERVLHWCGGQSARRAYATTLLDMEERRMALSPTLSPFSMTAIEERIKTMKNMKKKSALSALLAAVLVCVSCVALATGAPEGGAANKTYAAQDPNLTLSRESWEQTYSRYATYGLGYDEKIGRLTFGGKVVRNFEDMVPLDENANVGTVCMFPDGEVDVYAVRDLTVEIVRREDGSYDPTEAYPLTGLRAATQEEFDAFSRLLEENSEVLSEGHMAVQLDALSTTYVVTAKDGAMLVTEATDQLVQEAESEVLTTVVYITNADDAETIVASPLQSGVVTYSIVGSEDAAVEGTAEGVTTVIQSDDVTFYTTQEKLGDFDVVWWTADEYRAWMEEERAEIQELVGSGAKAYTQQDGWFVWTQEKADEAMAIYEHMLELIEQGYRISRSVDGVEGVMLMQGAEANR